MSHWESVTTLVGRPFTWNGRGPEAYDCWGLVLEGLTRLGLPAPAQAFCVSSDHPSSESTRIMDGQFSGASWERTEVLAAGDVVAMSHHTRIHHVGLMTPYGVLHSAPSHGAVIQPVSSLRAVGYRRIEGYRWVG